MRLQKKGSELGKRSLSQDDRVVGMAIITHNSDSRLLVISRKGFGKLTPVGKYRRQGRGGKGVLTFDIQPRKTGPVAVAEVVDDSKELYLVSEQAQVQRTNLSEISTTIGRKTSGVIIMRLAKGDAVSSIACVSDLDSGTTNATDKSNGKGKSEDSKPATGSKNGTAKAQRNGAASTEEDADETSVDLQLPLDEMTEDGDETDSDD